MSQFEEQLNSYRLNPTKVFLLSGLLLLSTLGINDAIQSTFTASGTRNRGIIGKVVFAGLLTTGSIIVVKHFDKPNIETIPLKEQKDLKGPKKT